MRHEIENILRFELRIYFLGPLTNFSFFFVFVFSISEIMTYLKEEDKRYSLIKFVSNCLLSFSIKLGS